MKLTAPQKRLLDMIVTEPVAAQDEINAKLSARNVVAGLAKKGALTLGLGITCNGVDYEITDDGLTALGYDPKTIEMPGNETVTAESSWVEDTMPETNNRAQDDAEFESMPGRGSDDRAPIDISAMTPGSQMIAIEMQENHRYPVTRYAGSDDRAPIEEKYGLDRWNPNQRDRKVMFTVKEIADRLAHDHSAIDTDRNATLPMPDVDPGDEPIPYVVDRVPVQFIDPCITAEDIHNLTGEAITIEARRMTSKEAHLAFEGVRMSPEEAKLTFVERAVQAGLPLKANRLQVGTGAIDSPTWKKNAHSATENNETKQIVCECNVRVKSRKLLAMLHQTTRIKPTVVEV